MKLAIMQPYFFPYIGYFQLIKATEKFICYDDVNFIKGGWINRNRILINGKEGYISAPLVKASSNKKINETLIDNHQKWNIKLLKTISLSYKKAPYYNHVFPWIEELITTPFSHINHLALSSIKQTCKYLGIDRDIVDTSAAYQNNELNGQTRVLSICKKENATIYINPIGGIELYDKEIFRQNGLELKFIRSKEIRYAQGSDNFIPWLSIIDIMMYNSIREIHHHLEQYDLI